jgi:hypothetical protein
MTVRTLFYALSPLGTHYLVCPDCVPLALKDQGRILAECIVETSELCAYCAGPGTEPVSVWERPL